ncbi:uncharacterized protein UHOD_12284 [Ustilago sp. UG-2017b]|nr:uncharacterized protein UHOD_12284 [Ustilago sp. UG-2017b]
MSARNNSNTGQAGLLLQVATYVGMPAGMESFRAADKAVQEWKADKTAALAGNNTCPTLSKLEPEFVAVIS